MKKKIFLYARISRDDGNKNPQTIEGQVKLLEEFAGKKDLGIIENVFMDDNITGAVFERPAFQQMEEHIKNGWQGILLIKDLSRLGRNNAKTLLMLDWFEENNVHVITADGRYDSECDNELAGIETWYNERYIRDISHKTRASIRSKQEQGQHLGKAPYGYKKVNKKLVIHEEEANVVKDIFLKFLAGMGINSITKSLNEANIISPGYIVYGSKWAGQTVKRMLQNMEYCGHTVAAKSYRATYKNKRQVMNKKEDWLISYNTHSPIINQKEYDTVQAMLAENSRQSCRQSRNIFSHVLICGKCGAPMYRRKVHGIWGYVCSNYVKKGSDHCTRHFCHENSLYERIAAELMGEVKNGGTVHDIVKKNDIERLEQKIIQVYKDYIENLISKEVYIHVSKEIEKEKENLYTMKSIEKDTISHLTEDEIKKCIDKRVIEMFIKEIKVLDLNEAVKLGYSDKIKDGPNQSVSSVAVITLK